VADPKVIEMHLRSAGTEECPACDPELPDPCPLHDAPPICPATSSTLSCVRDEGHEGRHLDPRGPEWHHIPWAVPCCDGFGCGRALSTARDLVAGRCFMCRP
jgi:hypothetical protein